MTEVIYKGPAKKIGGIWLRRWAQRRNDGSWTAGLSEVDDEFGTTAISHLHVQRGFPGTRDCHAQTEIWLNVLRAEHDTAP